MNTLALPRTARGASLGFHPERLDRLTAKRRTLALRCEAEPSPKNLALLAAFTNPILGRAARA